MQYLFRKLTANEVEARVQNCTADGFTLLIYKDARVDQNILDETFTPFGWQCKYEEYKGNLYCSVGIAGDYNEWIWKSNCGTESNTEKEKGEASDAFKRACFCWGIGRELYTSPKIKIKGNTKLLKDKNKYVPTYYEFDVIGLEVNDDRKITALKILGKSMEGGYHEDIIFDWKQETGEKPQKSAIKTSQKQSPTIPPAEKKDEPQTSEQPEITVEQAGNVQLTFGKYRGKLLKEVPANYIEYLVKNAYDKTLKKYAQILFDNQPPVSVAPLFEGGYEIDDELPF